LTDSGDITVLLGRASNGDRAALDELMPIVYGELRSTAERLFASEREQTLQPTAVVNEAYLQLVGSGVNWQDRTHFFALAARMMRRILVNQANARRALKRGGNQIRVTFDEGGLGEPAADDILELDQALDALKVRDGRHAEYLELFYFGGLNYDQIAAVHGVSPATVKRRLQFAKAWLRVYLDGHTI